MNRVDRRLALGFGLAGAFLGVLVALQSDWLFFYQNFTPEIVYSACGYGFQHPATVPPKLLSFLMRETQNFSCRDIDPNTPLGPPGFFSLVQLYFSIAVSFIWRISSVSYANLWPVVGILTGLYTAGCFVLLRQFFARSLTIVGAALLSTSPIALPIIVSLRDYSKAPFFIWTIVFLVWALRGRRVPVVAGWAAASGLSIGVGCGFRADLIIMLPLSIATLLVVWDVRVCFCRVIAVVVMTVVAIGSAYPALSNGKGGTYGSVIIQGLSDPFRNYLRLTSAPYSFGSRYSDELVFSSVASDAREGHPNWDKDEGVPVYGVSQATTLSGESWKRFFPYFLGDFVIQAFKSAGWILGYPILASPSALPDPGYPVMSGPRVSTFMAPVYTILAQPWMPWLGMAGMAVLLWGIWVRSRQEAVALGMLFTALVTYPVVQFSIRHVFHLEFIWVLAMLSLADFPFRFRSLSRSGWSFPCVLLAVVVAGISTCYFVVQHQQKVLVREFRQLLSNPREPIASSTDSGGLSPLNVPVPPRYASLVASPPDSMTPAIAAIGIQWDVRSGADRLLLTLTGASCVGEIKVSLNYIKREDVWQPFDEKISVRVEGSGEGTSILFPAFYRPTQHFSNVTINQLPKECIVKLERIVGKTVFPSLMSAVLAPGWASRPLHNGFGYF